MVPVGAMRGGGIQVLWGLKPAVEVDFEDERLGVHAEPVEDGLQQDLQEEWEVGANDAPVRGTGFV